MLLFHNMFGNYGWAILAFGLIVKLIMLPFQMKSKQSMMRTSMLNPRVKELEKKFGSNKQKYNEEVAKLYKEAKINPMSGCLWTLLPFPIIILLYQIVRQPLSTMMRLAAEEIATLTEVMTNLGFYTAGTARNASFYSELLVADAMHNHFSEVVSNPAVADFAAKLRDINFNFFGLNLTTTPQLRFWLGGITVTSVLLFLLPFVSAGLTILQTKIAQKGQPVQDAQAAQTAKTMNLMMPLMSVWICFTMPAMMGIYWIEQSVLAIVQDMVLNNAFTAKINGEMAEFLEAQRKKDEEIERKRAETERLKAEGKTQQNANTSKKRLAAQERNAEEQRQAAIRAAERAAKGQEDAVPASQVGNRRYARGRAYDPDRYLYDTAPARDESAENEE